MTSKKYKAHVMLGKIYDIDEGINILEINIIDDTITKPDRKY